MFKKTLIKLSTVNRLDYYACLCKSQYALDGQTHGWFVDYAHGFEENGQYVNCPICGQRFAV